MMSTFSCVKLGQFSYITNHRYHPMQYVEGEYNT